MIEAAKDDTPNKTERRSKPSNTILDRRETAQYIADIVLELRNMAKHHKMTTLQGLLEVAYYEAFGAATQAEIPPGEIERIQELSRAAAG